MSKTPITDKEVDDARNICMMNDEAAYTGHPQDYNVVMATFARELEIDLDAAKAALEESHLVIEEMEKLVQHFALFLDGKGYHQSQADEIEHLKRKVHLLLSNGKDSHE